MAQIIPLLGGVRGGFLGREILVNISRITGLPTPKSPPKRGLSNSKICVQSENYEKGVRLEIVNAFFLLMIDFYSFIIKIREKKRM